MPWPTSSGKLAVEVYLRDPFFSVPMPHSEHSPADPSGDQGIKRMLPAWMTSMLLHCLLVVALILGIRSVPRGAVEEPDRTTGIVLKRVTQTGEYFEGENLEREFARDTASADQSSSLAPTLPGEQESPFETTDYLPDSSTGVGAPNATNSGGGKFSVKGTGMGRKNLEGGKVRTGIFGLTGEGYKFVYVIDKSASMNAYEGRPLAAAKKELAQSIESLGKINQFQIIFYNEYLDIFNPTVVGKIFFATKPNKKLAKKFIRGVEATGSTKHLESLLKSVKLGADNIFFLTDGTDPSLNEEELFRIRRQNGGRAAIHVIQFGSQPPGVDNWLKKLARQNRGEYRFFRIDRLSSDNSKSDL